MGSGGGRGVRWGEGVGSGGGGVVSGRGGLEMDKAVHSLCKVSAFDKYRNSCKFCTTRET